MFESSVSFTNVTPPSTLLMHRDTIVAESRSVLADWDVKQPHLLPIGVSFVSVQQAEKDALAKLNADDSTSEAIPTFETKSQMDEWLAARDEARDKARDSARDHNTSVMLRWLSRRVLPLDRKNAKIVYNHLNLEQHQNERDKATISLRFRAVSIIDNYWIKQSNDQLRWDDVNVRKIPLSEGFGVVALAEGSTAATINSLMALTDAQAAAEVSVIGTYAKGCFRKGDSLYLLKTGPKHDVMAEALVSVLLSCSNVYGYLDYKLDAGKGLKGFPVTGVLATYCKMMSNNERDIVMASDMFNIAEEYAMEHFPKQFAQMCVVDYLVGNPDRHGGNWGFFRTAPEWDITGLHDLYDHNKAFGPISYLGKTDTGFSAAGRGTSSCLTLKRGAEKLIDISEFKFVNPVKAQWFECFNSIQYEGQQFLQEFERRCKHLGIDVLIH